MTVTMGWLLIPSEVRAWGIGSQLYLPGCHETITANALRNARLAVPTAPHITPTANETALIDEVQFEPPSDFVKDLAGMTLLLGVRDNDLKGNNPLDSLSLIEVHGDPATQDEHCIRAATDDDLPGNVTALETCRAFIVRRATEALDGLDAAGTVDANVRMNLSVYVSFAKHTDPKLPMFYVKMGQAMHALEDGFTHTYRTTDGSRITVVTNWIDNVTGTAANEERDGPVHLSALDDCRSTDPLVVRNFAMATQAATELLTIALTPTMSRAEKIAAFEALTTRYLTYQPGCTFENHWCDAPEPDVAATSGCSAGQTGGPLPWGTMLMIAAVVLVVTRRRAAIVASTVMVLALAARPSLADTDTKSPAPPPTKPKGSEAPAVPVVPTAPGDRKDAVQGLEPGRDEKTLTVKEVKQIREDKRLGSKYGFASMIGGSLVHGAGALTAAGRYRLNERWVVGLDLEWNPWVTSVPLAVKAGVFNVYGTLIHRIPMKFDRFNLRTSLHLGTSTQLFDVYGSPKFSTGPYAAFTPLGIDYDLGGSVRIVIDPVEIAVPVPHIGLIPLYYEQFRLMVGIQIGA
ncbi:hypothetical protein BH11MYX3_BH11MYX3_20280 [soil metagenome]